MLRTCLHNEQDITLPEMKCAKASNEEALFSSKKFCKIDTVAFWFVFDKYCLIME